MCNKQRWKNLIENLCQKHILVLFSHICIYKNHLEFLNFYNFTLWMNYWCSISAFLIQKLCLIGITMITFEIESQFPYLGLSRPYNIVKSKDITSLLKISITYVIGIRFFLYIFIQNRIIGHMIWIILRNLNPIWTQFVINLYLCNIFY